MTFSRIVFLNIVFFLSFSGAFAQKSYVTIAEASKKVIKKFEKAKQISLQLETEKKKSKLVEIISDEPILIDALIELAKVSYYEKDYDAAESYISEAINNTPDNTPELFNIYAGICKAKEDFECEKENLLKYTDNEIPFKKRRTAELRLNKLQEMSMIIENAAPVELEKMSYNINSEEYAEYKPVLSTNDSTIVFTRRINGQEDFYQSELTSKGWTIAEPIVEINTAGNEGAHAISPDGKYMIFTRCDAPKRYRSCDLYISLRKDGKWAEAKYMGIVNTESWESQAAFSPDGKTVYFSSSREGGIGSKDLYSISNENNEWGEVTNLGEVINTKGNEESPYIHPDGRTLYFMSTGHPGLGGYDLFISNKRLDGTWTKPRNMGPSINSTQDEGGLFVDLKGKYAYYSKTDKTEKGLISDIYRFELPQKFKPEPVSYINIKVIDAQTKTPIAATLLLKNKNERLPKSLKIPTSGIIEIIYPNEVYEVTIEKKGYLFFSDNINPEFRSKPDAPIVYTVELQVLPTKEEVVKNEEVILRNIYFETGKARLLSTSYTELDRLSSLLKTQEDLKIEILGHTDGVGNDEDNLLLSQKRANAVKSYLVSKEINSSRIQTKALGESQPIADNETEEGRAKNRRISFRLL